MPDDDGRALYESVDALLHPTTLSTRTGQQITSVTRTPLGAQESAYSGSNLVAIDALGDTDRVTRYLLKRVSPAWDYFMRVTDDDRGREALAWTSGLLDRLPPETTHAYVACARDGDGWAILLRDASGALLSRRDSIGVDEHLLILDALAAFHAAFWDDTGAARSEDGFNDPDNFYRVISPDAADADPDQQGVMPRIVRDGWAELPGTVGAELAGRLLALANDPGPLRRELERYPQTVVHGDMRAANLGLEGGQLLVLDWALAGREVPALDAVWYLVGPGGPGTMRHEESIEHYRQRLAARLGDRFDSAWWEPVLDLSLLGGLIRYGWIASRAMASGNAARRRQAEHDLAWLAPGARRGLELLS